MKRWPILAALGLFVAGGGVAVTRGILSGAYVGRVQPWAIGNTISYYVGTTTWTAVMFAGLNLIVAGLMGYYLWQIGQVWRMPRVYHYLVIVLAVALIWLSVCPVHYADYAGHASLVSRMHEVASRTMFLAMAAMMLMMVVQRETSTRTRLFAVAYLVLAAVSVLGYLTAGAWFMPAILLWESGYILAFMLLMAVARAKA